MRLLGALARWSPILLLAFATAALAQQQDQQQKQEQQDQQEQPADAPKPEEPAQPAEPVPAQPTTAEPTPAQPPPPKQKAPLGLYVEVDVGSYNPDTIDSSITTLSTHVASNTLELSEEQMARAAIGYKLNHNKGEFRLIFNGYAEDGYHFESAGGLAALDPTLGVPETAVLEPLLWWFVQVDDGHLTSLRWPPQWDPATDDTNGNGFVDDGEQRYPVRTCGPGSPAGCTPLPDVDLETVYFPSLQNRIQTYDLVFGNVWGPRRFQGRWFGGFRYFRYEGNIPAGAWLFTPPLGDLFTDGAFVQLINFREKAWGLGPTGLLEARFNFFNQVLQIYINGQASFVVESVEADSGLLASYVRDENLGLNIPVDATLNEQQTKSTWHTGAEAGVRVRLKNGLSFEGGYGVVGFLDSILLPTSIRIPQNLQESGQGTSAIYNTQDYVLKGWHAGFSFQF